MLRPLKGLSLGLLLVLLAAQPLSADEADPKQQLQAAMVPHLFNFVTWPEAAANRPGDHASHRICLAPDYPGSAAILATNGMRVRDKAIHVQLVDDGATAARQCDLLLVGAEGGAETDVLLEAVRNATVLTVAADEGKASRNTMMAFYADGQFVRMSVRLQRLADAGFAVSSRLLRLMRISDEDEKREAATTEVLP